VEGSHARRGRNWYPLVTRAGWPPDRSCEWATSTDGRCWARTSDLRLVEADSGREATAGHGAKRHESPAQQAKPDGAPLRDLPPPPRRGVQQASNGRPSVARLLATLASTTAITAGPAVSHARRVCTLRSFEQTARAVYRGRHLPPVGSYGRLWALVRCQGSKGARNAALRAWGRAHDAWALRRHPLAGPVIASWYDDSGSTGCGFHASYGIAALTVPCGTRVELCHDGCVTAVRDDSGPYVAGRMFDLNPTVKNAIGCGDLCTVRYRVLR
jgi:hypothetical protein